MIGALLEKNLGVMDLSFYPLLENVINWIPTDGFTIIIGPIKYMTMTGVLPEKFLGITNLSFYPSLKMLQICILKS